jgi:hypothetical protein
MSIYNSFSIPSAVSQNANAVLENVDCDPSVTVGDVVRVNSSGIAVKALADVLANALVLGVVESKSEPELATVRLSGISAEGIFSGLADATQYFLSETTAGLITPTAPVLSGQVVVKIGQSYGTDRLLVQIGERVLRT